VSLPHSPPDVWKYHEAACLAQLITDMLGTQSLNGSEGKLPSCVLNYCISLDVEGQRKHCKDPPHSV
jgi:hypothetical protein